MHKYLVILALLGFIALVASRAIILRRRGIRAIVFGETDKSDFLLIPVFLLFVYAILAFLFRLPLPTVLRQSFWSVPTLEWIGLVFCLIALGGFAYTLKSFGESFRVGIDANAPDKLITTGAFVVSRNPIYVCFLLFFFGMFLVFPSPLLIIALILFFLAIHRQTLREERFLESHYGEDYEEYRRKVRRYL